MAREYKIEHYLIKGFPFLKVLGDPFKKEELFGLKIGDKVSSVGTVAKSGKYGSHSRQEWWKPYIVYAGTIFTDYNYMAFRLPEDGISGKSLTDLGWDFYVLYTYIESDEGNDMIRQNFNTLSIRIFKPVFEFVNRDSK